MALGCDSWLRVVEPYLSEALVDDRGRNALYGIARQLPDRGIHIVEARLSNAAREVDLSIGLTDPESARALARRSIPVHLKAFLERWAEGAEDLAPVASIWLEFDHPADLEDLPAPVVCARLRGRPEAVWLSKTLFPALVGRVLDLSEEDLVRRLVAAIPAPARVLYAFSLLSRGGHALRLEIYGLPPNTILTYLGEVAPPRLLSQIKALIPLAEGCDRYHLSFDFGAQIGPRIGVEMGFERLPRREPRWPELLGRLVAAGLGSEEKCRAALSWPGYDTRLTAPERWPADTSGYCIRGLSHVKLVTWPERAPEAKVYLLFQHLKSRGELRGRGGDQK